MGSPRGDVACRLGKCSRSLPRIRLLGDFGVLRPRKVARLTRTGSQFAPQRFDVESSGLRLAGWCSGDVGPTLVFVHGFPDTHAVWDPVMARLTGRFRCLAYDVRGAGASAAPTTQGGYLVRHLIDDLATVIADQSPDQAVHLVGHDWGSVQCWDAVLRERSHPALTGRIASFTTISGPALHHVDAYVRSARRGDRARRRAAVRQLGHSWYVYAFLVPRVPDLLLRTSIRRLMRRLDPARDSFAPTLPTDAVNGLGLYRANTFSHEPVPGGPRTSLPVQLVVPLQDPFITASLVADVPRFAPNVTRRELDAGHWVMQSHPDQLARCIADFVTAITPASGE
jgi:pimeloyl-ACP methyl ester carboxylesterase